MGHRYRIYPDKEQREMLEKYFGCSRFVWNQMLNDRINYYEENQEWLDTPYTSYCMMYDFLNEVPKRVLQMTERNLNRAYKNFFNKIKKGNTKVGFPKFKSRHASRQSFQIYNDNNCIYLNKRKIERNLNDNTKFVKEYTDTIKLPKIDKPIKIVLHKPVDGRIKTVTISKYSSGEYYCSMNIDGWYKVDITPTKSVLGVDLGIKDLAILSDGTKLPNDDILDSYLGQLRFLQQKYSHTQRGSNRRAKLQKRIARLYRKIVNKRLDNIHKFTRKVVNENQVIITEDLNIKGMLSNKAHTEKKATRSRHISNASWYEFFRQFDYKCDWSGKTYKKIGKTYPSTQLCHVCGFQNIKLRNNTYIREWRCPSCNTLHDRDINAAINIRNEGKRILNLA